MKNDACILVVDDNPSRRNWLRHVLGALPCSIVEAPPAQHALRSLKQGPANAVVVGEGLRPRDLQRFHAVMLKRYPNIPVFMACPWPGGPDFMGMSPGGSHCLVLCTQDQGAGLEATLRKALEAQQEEKTCSDSIRTSAEPETQKDAA